MAWPFDTGCPAARRPSSAAAGNPAAVEDSLAEQADCRNRPSLDLAMPSARLAGSTSVALLRVRGQVVRQPQAEENPLVAENLRDEERLLLEEVIQRGFARSSAVRREDRWVGAGTEWERRWGLREVDWLSPADAAYIAKNCQQDCFRHGNEERWLDRIEVWEGL